MASDARDTAICMQRLFRGYQRAIRRIGPRTYLVRGNDEPRYVVNLNDEWPCTCADAYWHGRGCLHELAARLQEREPGVMLALGMALLKNQRAMQTLMGGGR